MGRGLQDLAGHNAWATAQVLAFCRTLDERDLEATVPGTYGTIIATLRHLIDAEASYVQRLTGAWPAHPGGMSRQSGSTCWRSGRRPWRPH